MTTLRDVVGSRIRTLRKAAKLSQAELAELIGTDPPLIGRYERGITMPSIEQLIKLSTALKVSPGELLPSQEDELREKLITLRRKISDIAMLVDSPEKLEQAITYLEKLGHDID